MLIEKLRRDIEQAFTIFNLQRSNKLSIERQRNIEEIRQILVGNNLVKVKLQLDEYVNNLSNGIVAWIPFLEINLFKSILKGVLNLPEYQETEILRAMIRELGVSLTQDNITMTEQGPDPSILQRIEKLEQSYQLQSDKMANMEQEIRRLKSENLFLSKTISLLAQKNKELISENENIKQEKNHQAEKYADLTEKYETLIKKNCELKSQLNRIAKTRSSFILRTSIKKEKTKSLYLPRRKLLEEEDSKVVKTRPHK